MAGSVPSAYRIASRVAPADQLREQLERAAAFVGPKTSFVSATLDVPARVPAGLLAAMPDQPFVAYGETVGLGMAAELRLDSLDAATASRWANRLLADENIGGPQVPSIFCGAAFAPSSVGSGRWREFPAFYLLLPRWTYRLHSTCATATLMLPVAHLGDARREEEAVAEIERMVACLEVEATNERPIQPSHSTQMPARDWEAMVGDALAEISAGRFQKIVLARTATIEASEPWSCESIFRRLSETPASTPFTVRFGSTTFMGASPEMLVSTGPEGHFETHALAGTIPAGTDEAALTRNAKNRDEHQLVVEEIERRLRPLCSELTIAREPVPMRLRDVVHLQTPISGWRNAGVHLLDLALALHPTPAVGGLPGKPAVEWIRAHEPEPRGWYAGFLGWFDRHGSGRLGVAIRSGLLTGNEACLYTGAGIVAGSDASAEYQETSWKQRPFLRALGIELPA